jgi:hypothetical protein
MANHIPEYVIYVLRAPDTTKVESVIEKIQRATVVDASNTSALNAAMRWAGKDAVQFCRHNDIPSLRFIEMRYGRHHNQTWYARVFDRFCVEVPDETVASLLRNATMVDGSFQGPFRWGTIGSGLRLLRVESPDWDEVVKKSNRRAMPKIRKSDLEVNRIYVHEDGMSWVYLGLVDRTIYASKYNAPDTYKLTTESGELWVRLHSIPFTENMYGLEIHNGHRVVEALEMSSVLGPDPIATIRSVAMETVRARIKKREAHNGALAAQHLRISTTDQQYFAAQSSHLLLRRKGEPVPVIPELAGIESRVR